MAPLVLLLRKPVHDVPGGGIIKGNLRFALLALLGIDDHCAIGSPHAVKCCGSTTFEHHHVVNIVGIDIEGAVGLVGKIGTAVRIVNGNTIHNKKRIVAAIDGGVASDTYRGGSSRRTRCRGDLHAGYFGIEAVYHVDLPRFAELLTAYVSNAVAKLTLVFLNADGRDHNLFKKFVVGLELDIDCGASLYFFEGAAVAQKRKLQAPFCKFLIAELYFIFAVKASGHALGSTLKGNGDAWQWH